MELGPRKEHPYHGYGNLIPLMVVCVCVSIYIYIYIYILEKGQEGNITKELNPKLRLGFSLGLRLWGLRVSDLGL